MPVRCLFQKQVMQEWRERFFLQGQLSVLILILVSIPPHVTAEAHERLSFCQKWRWQVTAKHACILCIWLCIKWHGAWLNGIHRTQCCGVRSSFKRHQPCQYCKYTTLVTNQNAPLKASHSCRISSEHSESARERRTALYKNNPLQQLHELWSLLCLFDVFQELINSLVCWLFTEYGSLPRFWSTERNKSYPITETHTQKHKDNL